MNIINKESTTRTDGAVIQKGKYHTNTNIVDKRGNPLPMVVQMVSECIAHYRRQVGGRQIKTIWLCPAYYVKFTDWVRNRCLDEQADMNIKQYTFDGACVDIMPEDQLTKTGGTLDSQLMNWEFYPTMEEVKAQMKEKQQLTIVK